MHRIFCIAEVCKKTDNRRFSWLLLGCLVIQNPALAGSKEFGKTPTRRLLCSSQIDLSFCHQAEPILVKLSPVEPSSLAPFSCLFSSTNSLSCPACLGPDDCSAAVIYLLIHIHDKNKGKVREHTQSHNRDIPFVCSSFRSKKHVCAIVFEVLNFELVQGLLVSDAISEEGQPRTVVSRIASGPFKKKAKKKEKKKKTHTQLGYGTSIGTINNRLRQK